MTVQERYDALIAAGESPRMAEMLATRSAPGLRTDTQFLVGRHDNFGVKETWLADRLRKAGADRNGVYDPGLAQYPGDPRAVVSSRDAVRKRCEAEGWGCEGDVNVKRDVRVAPASVDVAPDIVANEVAKEIAADPAKGETPKKREKTRQAVKNRLKGHYA